MKHTLIALLTIIILSKATCSAAGMQSTAQKVDSLVQVLSETTSDSMRTLLLIQLSNHYTSTDYKLSFRYAEEALETSLKIKSNTLRAQATTNAAWVCFRLGVMDLAVRYFTDHLEMVEKTGTEIEKAEAIFNLGVIKLSLKEFKEGEELQLKALGLLNSVKEEMADTTLINGMTILLYNNLGYLYRETGDFATAAENSLKGIELARNCTNCELQLALLLNNYGETLIKQGKFDEASSAIRESLEIRNSLGDIPGEANALVSLGNLFNATGNSRAALLNYDKSYRLAVQVGGFTLIQSAAEQLYKLYEKTGPADSTLKYLSIFNQNEEKIKQNKAREDLIRKEIAALRLERENDQKAMETKERRRIFLTAFMVTFAGILLLAIMLIIRKKYRKSLAEKHSIRQRADALEEENSTRDKLFAIIAHDLRGPVGNLKQGLELITNGTPMDEKTKEGILEELKKGTKNTFGLLENLLSWSKLQGNTFLLNPNRIEIYPLIQENVALLSTLARQKGIGLFVREEKPLYTFADQESVNLILRNLLSNAIKFTPHNGNIHISANRGNGFVEVEVTDDGIGMTREVTDNLFKVNSHYTTYGTNGEKGTGLGLGLVREFVERNGGTIRVESEPGKGSKFMFTLPESI